MLALMRLRKSLKERFKGSGFSLKKKRIYLQINKGKSGLPNLVLYFQDVNKVFTKQEWGCEVRPMKNTSKTWNLYTMEQKETVQSTDETCSCTMDWNLGLFLLTLQF